MYVSDYLLAFSSSLSSNSWIIFSYPAWTLSSYNFGFIDVNSYFWGAWYIYTYGSIDRDHFLWYSEGTLYLGQYEVHPTFYLNNDIQYISGTGTQSNPIRIN